MYEIARAMLHTVLLDDTVLTSASLQHSVTLINATPKDRAGKSVTPWNAFEPQPFRYDLLHIWGAPCMVHVPRKLRHYTV